MATWSSFAPGRATSWTLTSTFGPARPQPPAQPSRTQTRPASRRAATRSRRDRATAAASSRRGRPPRSTGSTTMPSSRGQTVMTSRRSTLGLLDTGFGDKGLASFPISARRSLHSQICLLDALVGEQSLPRPFQHHPPRVEHVPTVARFERFGHPLLDEQDGKLLEVVDLLDPVEDRVHQRRRQAHGRLVEQEEAGTRRQAAPDGEHLLLAAREGPRELTPALGERRKELEDAGEVVGPPRARRRRQRPHLEVLHHGHGAEDLAALGNVGDAEPGPLRGREAQEVAPLVDDAPGGGRDRPRDRLEEGRLAGAVRADDGHELAVSDLQRDLPQRAETAVGDTEPANREHAPPTASRGRPR